jgi:hypothetical protein
VASWAVQGIELPFGDQVKAWWIDQSGSWTEQPVPAAEALPGHFVLSGLVDAHSHPTVGGGPAGLLPSIQTGCGPISSGGPKPASPRYETGAHPEASL